MATTQELERAFLNAHRAGDKQVAQALADALRSAMAAQPAETPAAPKERTFGEAAKDIGAGVVSGVGALTQLPGQLYGLATGDFSDTGLTKVGREIREAGEAMKSEELKRREAERAAKIPRDRAHISALAAFRFKHRRLSIKREKCQRMNFNNARLQLNRFTATRQIIGALAINFDR